MGWSKASSSVLARRYQHPLSLGTQNHIWDEWAFKKWVESDEYTGPDMTDFGRRSLVDAAFNEEYKKEKRAFCQRILEMTTLLSSTAT